MKLTTDMVAARFVRGRLGELIVVTLRGQWMETIVAMACEDDGWRPSRAGHWYDLERGRVGLEVKCVAIVRRPIHLQRSARSPARSTAITPGSRRHCAVRQPWRRNQLQRVRLGCPRSQ